MAERIEQISKATLLKNKLSALAILFKIRLATFVVFSSVVGLLVAGNFSSSFLDIVVLVLAGFLVTGASSAFNQIFEKESDALMKRTQSRPMVTGAFSKAEASLYAGVAALLGLLMLSFYFNDVAALVAAISLISYSFIYTPLKKVSNIAVFVGAIPGALPPMIGAVAFDGSFGFWAIFLFTIQFIWQFPHFWAIAWLGFDDYKKADIMLLPSHSGKTKQSTLITLSYTFVLLPLSFYPFFVGKMGMVGTSIALFTAVFFLYFAYRFHTDNTDKSARNLMFASFFYLPVALLTFLFDKI